ncbi:MAG: ferritin [Lachnospiraceae bacterium]|nr:ferritin [Lachnospiraceae bacterium]
MNAKVAELLNAQVNKEFYSAYLYLGIAKYFKKQNLNGFAAWYKVQAEEEKEHAMKFYDYILDNDGDVTLKPISEVSLELSDVMAAVKAADEHEHYITAEINKIYDAAVEAKDYRTQLFLNYFITEQAEEEENSGEMIVKVEMLGKDTKGLYMLDKELGERK